MLKSVWFLSLFVVACFFLPTRDFIRSPAVQLYCPQLVVVSFPWNSRSIRLTQVLVQFSESLLLIAKCCDIWETLLCISLLLKHLSASLRLVIVFRFLVQRWSWLVMATLATTCAKPFKVVFTCVVKIRNLLWLDIGFTFILSPYFRSGGYYHEVKISLLPGSGMVLKDYISDNFPIQTTLFG